MNQKLKRKIIRGYYRINITMILVLGALVTPFVASLIQIMRGVMKWDWAHFIFFSMLSFILIGTNIFFIWRLFQPPMLQFQKDIEAYRIQLYYSEEQLFDMMQQGNKLGKHAWMTPQFLFFVRTGTLRVIPYALIDRMYIRYRSRSFGHYDVYIFSRDKRFASPVADGSKKACQNYLMIIDAQKRACLDSLRQYQS